MERLRSGSPVYVRQRSISSASGDSPVSSPARRHLRTGSSGSATFRRPQNTAARAAAQRLAQVMSHQSADDDDDEEDDGLALSSISVPAGRSSARSQSPKTAKKRSPSPATSAGRPSVAAKPIFIVPASKPFLKPQPVATFPEPSTVATTSEPPTVATTSELPATDNRREKRSSTPTDFGVVNGRETGNQRSASALQDEIDMLQEENESILEKLRLAEERCEEAETRARQFEKQVASFGEGVPLEARLLSRKESALQQKEAALKVEAETNIRNEEVTALRMEAECAREEASSVLDQLQEVESEIKSLRTMSQRMILSEEEMEEVVLKRCWLARYWKLCVRHGLYAEISGGKLEYWSSLAPLPLEVVLSAGQRAKEESSTGDGEERIRVPRDLNDLAGEGNIENMLLVDKGLRELASLKVEEAVVLAMAEHRRPYLDSKLQNEGHNPLEAFELSYEESEDVLFKQAWLIYFWRRAKNHAVELDIADDRLQFWINLSARSPTSHDAVDVLKLLATDLSGVYMS
ncbi:hypothetical protein AAC387_Pa10g0265 [Persea americana]